MLDMSTSRESACLGQFGIQFDRVRAQLLFLHGAGAHAQEPVELLGHHINGLVGIVAFHGDDHIGTADFDVPLGKESRFAFAYFIIFQINAYSNYSSLMPEEPFTFAFSESPERLGYI